MSAFFIFQLVVLIFSVMIHEIAHGYMAEHLGDHTARDAGRLTLNPLRHIDPFGSIFLPFLLAITNSPIILGWAKPVPYDPNNLHKDYKYGPLKVALSGPFSNILILVAVGLVARFGVGFLNPLTSGFLGFVAYLNIFLAIFNLVPIPPLDGSKILPLVLPGKTIWDIEKFGFAGILLIFVFLYFFAGFVSKIAAIILVFVAGSDVFSAMVDVLQMF